jgi:sodium transport system ATP-binding protein
MVRTFELKKHFRDQKGRTVKAVDGVSFEAKPGEVFGLLGVNGAGKTTCLRMLSTVLWPTSGRAEVAGYDVRKDSASVRSSIGFLSNSTALYGRLTPRETLAYFGGLYGLSGKRLSERIAYAVEALGIEPYIDRLCDKLSTGQKQRLSIARAILHDPPVLFFDEPTVGLDVLTSQTVMEFIEGVRDQGKTVVFSTHIMSEAERLCDRIAVIHHGLICGEGSVQDLLDSTGEESLEKAFLKVVGYQAGKEETTL